MFKILTSIFFVLLSLSTQAASPLVAIYNKPGNKTPSPIQVMVYNLDGQLCYKGDISEYTYRTLITKDQVNCRKTHGYILFAKYQFDGMDGYYPYTDGPADHFEIYHNVDSDHVANMTFFSYFEYDNELAKHSK